MAVKFTVAPNVFEKVPEKGKEFFVRLDTRDNTVVLQVSEAWVGSLWHDVLYLDTETGEVVMCYGVKSNMGLRVDSKGKVCVM